MSGSCGAIRDSTASIPLVLEFHCFRWKTCASSVADQRDPNTGVYTIDGIRICASSAQCRDPPKPSADAKPSSLRECVDQSIAQSLQGFVRWATTFVSGERLFSHRWQSPKCGRWSCSSIGHALSRLQVAVLRHLAWPGLANHGKSFQSFQENASILRRFPHL